MRDLFNQLISTYVYQKEWGVYPFIPPIFSLLLALVLIPIYESLFYERLQTFLGGRGLDSSFELISAITSARGLQIAYLTEVSVFAISVIAALQANYPKLLLGLTLCGIVLAILLSPEVFIKDPDWLVTTPFPAKRKPAFLAKRGWTQKTFYTAFLVVLNLFFILILIITLPEKRVPTGSNNGEAIAPVPHQ